MIEDQGGMALAKLLQVLDMQRFNELYNSATD